MPILIIFHIIPFHFIYIFLLQIMAVFSTHYQYEYDIDNDIRKTTMRKLFIVFQHTHVNNQVKGIGRLITF